MVRSDSGLFWTWAYAGTQVADAARHRAFDGIWPWRAFQPKAYASTEEVFKRLRNQVAHFQSQRKDVGGSRKSQLLGEISALRQDLAHIADGAIEGALAASQSRTIKGCRRSSTCRTRLSHLSVGGLKSSRLTFRSGSVKSKKVLPPGRIL